MLKTLLLLFLFNTTLQAQSGQDIYSIKIGGYDCKPAFYVNGHNPAQILSAVDKSALNKGIKVHFPPRADTIDVYDPEKGISEKVPLIDHYEFQAGVDSIPKAQLNSLLNGTICAFHNDKAVSYMSYAISVVFADGTLLMADGKAPRLSENKNFRALMQGNKEITYIGISNIWLKNEKREKFQILEGYGWKFY